MTIEVVMPKIGLTMKEGKIVEWNKKEGEWVEEGEILFVFETEKVTFEVEAQKSGYLGKILAQVDQVVPVGQVVGILVQTQGEEIELKAQIPPEVLPVEAQKQSSAAGNKRPEKVRATPMAKRLAKERGIDLQSLSGSGIGGRIKTRDLDFAPDLKSPGPDRSCAGEERLVKLTGMRRIIAQKMLAAKTGTAQTYMVVSIDATKIQETKHRLAPVVQKLAGVRLTVTDLLIKMTASAILQHPVMNTRWTPEGIIYLDAVHMGMAMALDEGLIVPVIRDAAKKSVSEIARERAALVENGRAGKLTPDQMSGSTFTLSSLGMFGIEEFTAIINQPESAILAVGAILDKPVAAGKEIVIRPVMKITLSYDHRVIDGAAAAGFVKTLKEFLENTILALA